jgi:hypothetical protein
MSSHGLSPNKALQAMRYRARLSASVRRQRRGEKLPTYAEARELSHILLYVAPRIGAVSSRFRVV